MRTGWCAVSEAIKIVDGDLLRVNCSSLHAGKQNNKKKYSFTGRIESLVIIHFKHKVPLASKCIHQMPREAKQISLRT